jgi:hypothetical protein
MCENNDVTLWDRCAISAQRQPESGQSQARCAWVVGWLTETLVRTPTSHPSHKLHINGNVGDACTCIRTQTITTKKKLSSCCLRLCIGFSFRLCTAVLRLYFDLEQANHAVDWWSDPPLGLVKSSKTLYMDRRSTESQKSSAVTAKSGC